MPARILLALILIVLGLVGAGGSPAFAQTGPGERILSFASDIRVGLDGELHVTETIRVRALGERIRRGIFRDFPTRYRREGRAVRVGFDVDEVLKDGDEEPYRLESISGGVRIRIGDPDVLLDTGEHVYTIRYRTTRQLGFFDSYDELYWNVTGNFWEFPIDQVELRLTLPDAVPFGQRAFYTGRQGAVGRDARVVTERPGEIVVRSTMPLAPSEGLTVAIAWPKGVVQAPRPPTAAERWAERYGPPLAALLAIAGIAAFYFHAWRAAGRGPPAGTVVPLFSPPDGLSAAAVRYIHEMNYDNRAFAAALVESGVKGEVRLIETDGGFFSGDELRIERTGDGTSMPGPERRMLGHLFQGGDSIEVEQKNHARFRAAQEALSDALSAAYKGRLFLTNLGWAVAGLLIILAALLFTATVIAFADPYAHSGSWFTPAAGLGAMLLALAAGSSSRLVIRDGSLLLAVAACLLGIAALVALATSLPAAVDSGKILFVLAPLVTLPIAISAFWWMSAPTRQGRQIMDRIAGFRHYLAITEEDRLETLHPPEKTPELFERYLPFAIALEVENRWAAKFASVLAAASAEPNRKDMNWYSGSHSPWTSPSRFAGALGSSLASSVASASTAPGSSSGSGGGGFSGGGGGGGGGGGW